MQHCSVCEQLESLGKYLLLASYPLTSLESAIFSTLHDHNCDVMQTISIMGLWSDVCPTS